MSSFGIGKFGSTALGVAASAVLVAGCASSSSSKTTTTGAGAGGLNTRSTSIGTVLVDSSGHTVYELDGNTASHQTCTGSCAGIWPPLMSGGTQVVVNGHPAFTFSGDSSAGKTTGQGVQDQCCHWFALDARGNPSA